MKRLVQLAGFLFVGYLVGEVGLRLVALFAKVPVHGPVLPIAGGVAGAAIGLLFWLGGGRRRSSSDAQGSAHFATAKDAQRTLSDQDGLIVGRAKTGALLRYDGPSHILTIAPTRSGKGVGAVIPNLLTTQRSVLCIDPKGENARIAYRARLRFGPVYVLDPFEVTGFTSASFNLLARLDPNSIDVAEDAALIAEALVHDPPQQVSEAHWNEEAKALIAGLILHIIASRTPAERTLGTVRELLTTTPMCFEAELHAMQASAAAHGLVARAANRHLAKADREAAGVLSAAQRHTHFLDSPRMVRSLARSDFAFADLKTGAASVFLVLPLDRLATHARWLRLLVVQALAELTRAPATSASRVLFLLDEFAALGRLEVAERAFGLMAGYGVQLWAILQDLHQLNATYGAAAGTFLSNAALMQIFNVADVETATWVSRMLGVTTEAYQTTSQSKSHAFGRLSTTRSSSTNLHLVKRDLMTPDEVMRMGADRMLLLRPGHAPLVGRKVRYYADAEFAGRFDA